MGYLTILLQLQSVTEMERWSWFVWVHVTEVEAGRYYPDICMGRLRKTVKNLRIASNPVEMQTRYLLNTCLEYHWSISWALN